MKRLYFLLSYFLFIFVCNDKMLSQNAEELDGSVYNHHTNDGSREAFDVASLQKTTRARKTQPRKTQSARRPRTYSQKIVNKKSFQKSSSANTIGSAHQRGKPRVIKKTVKNTIQRVRREQPQKQRKALVKKHSRGLKKGQHSIASREHLQRTDRKKLRREKKINSRVAPLRDEVKKGSASDLLDTIPAILSSSDSQAIRGEHFDESLKTMRGEQSHRNIHNVIHAYCNDLIQQLEKQATAANSLRVLASLGYVDKAVADLSVHDTLESGDVVTTKKSKHLSELRFPPNYRSFYEGKRFTFVPEYGLTPFSPFIKLLLILSQRLSTSSLARLNPMVAYLRNEPGKEELGMALYYLDIFKTEGLPRLMQQLTGEPITKVLGYADFDLEFRKLRDSLTNNGRLKIYEQLRR